MRNNNGFVRLAHVVVRLPHVVIRLAIVVIIFASVIIIKGFRVDNLVMLFGFHQYPALVGATRVAAM